MFNAKKIFLSIIFVSFCNISFADEINKLGFPLAANNVLALNSAMMGIYESELTRYQAKLMTTTPVIVARFSGDGGHLTLYQPGKDPLVASEPPITYKLAKSVGHSAMVTYEMTEPYIKTSKTDKSWQPQMQQFQLKIATALSTLDGLDVSNTDKIVFKNTLTKINNYLLRCLSQGYVDQKDLEAFAKQVKPDLPQLIKIAATSQTSHQMAVIAQWKKLLGKDWKNTYALTNTMYVTRQNNLLFSMLAEFMGKNAINHRLFLFETTTFTTTDENLLNLWARLMSDRGLAQTMLGEYYVMDSELLSNGGRQIILQEAKKYNLPAILPSEEPFDSTDWPWRHNPHSGTGAADLNEIK